jgi:hypothetical protein
VAATNRAAVWVERTSKSKEGRKDEEKKRDTARGRESVVLSNDEFVLLVPGSEMQEGANGRAREYIFSDLERGMYVYRIEALRWNGSMKVWFYGGGVVLWGMSILHGPCYRKSATPRTFSCPPRSVYLWEV